MKVVRIISLTIFSRFLFFLLIFFLILFCDKFVKGGNCWAGMGQRGRCTELLSEKVDREGCCKDTNGLGAAWSEEDLEPGTMFFWRVLGGGVECKPCKESCLNINCEEGKKCVMRNGFPKCICSPDCKHKGRHMKGSVCGTDGRTYKTVCRLRKRACRKAQSISINYYGSCQSGSCDRITCPSGKFCVLDQNFSPHCVKCTRHCVSSHDSHLVCGADGITYESTCHLRETACRKGKAIPIAYKGNCKASANCATIQCQKGQTCLTNLRNKSPRCVTCSYSCPKSKFGIKSPSLCGNNHVTYSSWCELMADACEQRIVIETKHSGTCEPREHWKNLVQSNSVEDLVNS